MTWMKFRLERSSVRTNMVALIEFKNLALTHYSKFFAPFFLAQLELFHTFFHGSQYESYVENVFISDVQLCSLFNIFNAQLLW